MSLDTKRLKSHTCCSMSQHKSHACCSMSQQMKLLVSMVLIPSLVQMVHSEGQVEDESMTTYYRDFRMPGVSTTKSDNYLCTAMALNTSMEEWVLAFEPEVTIEKAHHMSLYGCAEIRQTSRVWDCRHLGVCYRARVLCMWANNAPAIALPSGVGFRVGGSSGINFLTLQVHYKTFTPVMEDRSGYKIQFTTKRQPFAAGLLSVVSAPGTLPPNTARAHLAGSCQLKSVKFLNDIHIMGLRVHTHNLGTVVKAYRYDVKTGEYELLIAGNPQWPQAIYPRKEVMTVTPEDAVAVRCTYDTTGIETITHTGKRNVEEMCAVYILYYTEHERASNWLACAGVHDPDVIKNLPEGNDEPLPPNPILSAKAHASSIDMGEVITYLPVVAQAPASRRIEEASSGGQ